MTKVDYTGRRFGRLVAIKPLYSDGRHWIWLFQCDCGKTYEYVPSKLSGTLSCGCLHYEMRSAMGKKYITKAQASRTLIEGTSATHLTNGLWKNNTSGVRGVHLVKRTGMWFAYITFKQKRYNLGTYINFDDAVAARKKAEQQIWGNFLDWYYKHKETNCMISKALL